MKKRGIQPDSFTYGTILRGFAHLETINPKLLALARSVYSSIEKPMHIHTNMMLAIYKKGKALDEMWTMIGKLKSRDMDKATFSTFFEALATEEDPQVAAEDGVRAWAGVLNRWSNNQLEIDDTLLSSIMFLLSRSPQEKHWEEVFKIAESVFPNFDFNAGGIRYPQATQRPKYTEKVLIPLLKAAGNLKSLERTEYVWSQFRGSAPTIQTHKLYLYNLQASRAATKSLEFLQKLVERKFVVPDDQCFIIALRSCYIRAAKPPFLMVAQDILNLASAQNEKKLKDEILQTYLNVCNASKNPLDIKRALNTIKPYLIDRTPPGKTKEKLKARDMLNSSIKEAISRDDIEWTGDEKYHWTQLLWKLKGQGDATPEEDALEAADEPRFKKRTNYGERRRAREEKEALQKAQSLKDKSLKKDFALANVAKKSKEPKELTPRRKKREQWWDENKESISERTDAARFIPHKDRIAAVEGEDLKGAPKRVPYVMGSFEGKYDSNGPGLYAEEKASNPGYTPSREERRKSFFENVKSSSPAIRRGYKGFGAYGASEDSGESGVLSSSRGYKGEREVRDWTHDAVKEGSRRNFQRIGAPWLDRVSGSFGGRGGGRGGPRGGSFSGRSAERR